MSDMLPNLRLPLLMPSQAQKHVTHNEALRILDSVTQLSVLSRDQTLPSTTPSEGDRHIVASAASGIWAGNDMAIATFGNGAWQFDAPQAGWQGYDAGTGETIRFDGTSWGPLPLPEQLDNMSGLGVNTVADATNRLAVSSTATLLTHEGNGHQLKINKAAAGDTASLLFQTNWAGRAEMGLAGQNDWSIKVSPDGSSWTTALQFDATRVLLH